MPYQPSKAVAMILSCEALVQKKAGRINKQSDKRWFSDNFNQPESDMIVPVGKKLKRRMG